MNINQISEDAFEKAKDHFRRLEQIEKIEKERRKKFHEKVMSGEINFYKFVFRIREKYGSVAYKNREYLKCKRMPTEPLFFELYEYAKEYGIEKYDPKERDSYYEIFGHKFMMICGQECFISIQEPTFGKNLPLDKVLNLEDSIQILSGSLQTDPQLEDFWIKNPDGSANNNSFELREAMITLRNSYKKINEIIERLKKENEKWQTK